MVGSTPEGAFGIILIQNPERDSNSAFTFLSGYGAQAVQQSLNIGRQGTVESQGIARNRMIKAQVRRVQRLSPTLFLLTALAVGLLVAMWATGYLGAAAKHSQSAAFRKQTAVKRAAAFIGY